MISKLIFSSDSQDALLEQAGGALVFLFENQHHVKAASSSAMSEKLMRDHMPDDRHFGAHLIAMGSEENYGSNRNIDAWPEHELRARHHTFVKSGHFFREHRNRDPKLAIGTIKASAYNEDMDRVELIVHGDKEKAGPEWERCRNNKSSSYSMSARVKGDRCSCCGHFAKKSSEYCSHVRNHPNQWVKEFSKFAFVSNVEPTFFDISDVGYPADRIAHHLEYLLAKSDLEKSASANGHPICSSAELAERAGVALPDEQRIGASTPARNRWLTKLASLEARVEQLRRQPDHSPLALFLKHASASALVPVPCTDAEFDRLRALDPGVLFTKLAAHGAILPFEWFSAICRNLPLSQIHTDPVTKVAAGRLGSVFRRLQVEPSSAELESLMDLASNYKAACACAPDPIDDFLNQLGQAYSIRPATVSMRILIASNAPSQLCKSAAGSDAQLASEGKLLADAYGFYKLGFVEYAETNLQPEFVDEPAQVLLVSSHQF